ncbi:MAG: hypothetical protein U9Q22_05890, partial [Candidatus Altiarchaeota archaeon]|nr:hypothetical protein [Candidatus Altiarchaeota archaeon]
ILLSGLSHASVLSQVYRFWSDEKQGHFYTISAAEKDYVETLPEWRYEGIAWYSWPEQSSGTSPIYRFWSDEKQHHFYTISAAEKDYVETLPEWRYEGIAYYAVDKSIFRIHISHLSMPSQVIPGETYSSSVKFEEGDFNSIGEAQAFAIIPITETQTIMTIAIKIGGLTLTGDTIEFPVYIPSQVRGSGPIIIAIVDCPGDPGELFDNPDKYIVSNFLEYNITITTSVMNQSQEFSTTDDLTDDLNVTYEFLSEDREIIKDGLKLQSSSLK